MSLIIPADLSTPIIGTFPTQLPVMGPLPGISSPAPSKDVQAPVSRMFAPVGGGDSGGGSSGGGIGLPSFGGGGSQTPIGLKQQFTDLNTKVCGQWLNLTYYNHDNPLYVLLDCGKWDVTAGELDTVILFSGLSFLLNSAGVSNQTSDPNAAKTGQAGSGEDEIVNVTVNNAETIATDTLNRVSDAVSGAVSAGAQAATDVANKAFGDIIDGLKNIAERIWQGVKDALSAIASSIGNIVSDIYHNLGSIIEKVAGALKDVIVQIKDAVVAAVQAITPVIDKIAKQVQDINDHLIQPIANVINTTIKTIADLTVAIEKDLHEGLSGILHIPTDIANGLSGLDATLNRTVQEIGQHNKEVADSNLTYAGVNVAGHVQSIKDQLAKSGGNWNAVFTTFSEHSKLGELDANSVGRRITDLVPELMKQELQVVLGLFQGIFDDLKKTLLAGELTIALIVDAVPVLVVMAIAVLKIIEPLNEFFGEEVKKQIPLVKLDVNTAIEAFKRGFVTEPELREELQVQGYDDTRITKFIDLSRYLIDVGTILDLWFRGLVSDNDVTSNLTEHGVPKDVGGTIREGSYHLPATVEILRWRHFQLIDDDSAMKMLGHLRYRPEHAQAYLDTEQTRESANARAALDGRLNVTAKDWLRDTMLTATPQAVIEAGLREGLHPDTIRLVWQAHWMTPNYMTMTQSYFRGLRTLTELQNVMESENIPHELWDELIQIQRPLIPFRSIPAYVKAGVLNEAQGRDMLRAHGFDIGLADKILSYVQKTASKTTAAVATQVHTLSVSNARTLYEHGSLTEQQYEDVLVAHGYTVDLAKAQVQSDLLAEQTKQRKQDLTDLQALVESGSVSLSDALDQLNKSGYSPGEVAKFQKQIARSTKINTKHPSIADLEKFFKAQFISIDDVQAELVAQGWADPWLTAWINFFSNPKGTQPPAVQPA